MCGACWFISGWKERLRRPPAEVSVTHLGGFFKECWPGGHAGHGCQDHAPPHQLAFPSPGLRPPGQPGRASLWLQRASTRYGGRSSTLAGPPLGPPGVPSCLPPSEKGADPPVPLRRGRPPPPRAQRMSALRGGGILGPTTASIALDFSLMAWPLSHNLTGNQSLPTTDPLNSSMGADLSRRPIKEKNWPALLILAIIVLTIGGNILVIMAVSLEKKLQNATNYFLMSLAVADMLVGILVMPVSLVTILYDYAWPLPKQLCPIWISLDVLFSTASIMHLCAISLDRYVAIRNPIEHSRFNSRTKAIMKIAAVWTISMGISLPIPVIGLQDDSRVFVNGSCVLNDENFVLVGSFVAFFIPLLIMVFAYCLTVQVLRKQASLFLYGEPRKPRRSSASCPRKDLPVESLSMLQNLEAASHWNSPVHREGVLFRKGTMQSINNERRASKVLGIVFFLFLVMWCPFFITNIMSVLCQDACDRAVLRELLDVFVWVGYICSGVNPLVYTLFNKIYRRAFSNYIRCHYGSGKRASQLHNAGPSVSSTAFCARDLNLNSYRHELNSTELDEMDEALEMHVGTPELSVNSCSGEKTSSV